MTGSRLPGSKLPGSRMPAWTRARLLVATLVATVALVGGAALPASAAVRRATPSASDCEALGNLGDNISDGGGGSSLFGRQAGAAADGFRETASEIDDPRLKKAMKRVASVYEDLSDANNVASALTVTVRAGRGYVRALNRFTTASLQCATASITLPTGVTLPGGVTIPSIPLPR